MCRRGMKGWRIMTNYDDLVMYWNDKAIELGNQVSVLTREKTQIKNNANAWIGRLESYIKDNEDLLKDCMSYLQTLPDDEERASLLARLNTTIGPDYD